MQGYSISHDAGLTVNHERLQACNCINHHNNVSILKLLRNRRISVRSHGTAGYNENKKRLYTLSLKVNSTIQCITPHDTAQQ